VRKVTTPEQRQAALALVKRALEARLAQKGELTFASSHEVYGILAEEMNELLYAVRENNQHYQREELIDLAIAAIFGIVSLDAGGLEW
jgi:NTP pyrophosphatase (non-canonical NTP hydrolase)